MPSCRTCLRLPCLLLLSLIGGVASAQTPPASIPVLGQAAPAQTPFSAEPSVIENISTIVNMNADGTGSRRQTFSIRIQSDSVLRTFSIVALSFPHSSEVAEFVYARVRHPNGTVQETPVSNAIEQPAPVTREAPFYSDLQVKQLPIKNLSVGDTLEWQARTTITHPEVPGQFWGQGTISENVVVLKEIFELRTPLAVHPILWTNPRGKVAFTETTEGTERVDRWTHSDQHPTVGPAAETAKLAEEKRLRTPDEEMDLTEGKLPAFAWTTFPDWAAVGSWYRELSIGRAVPDAAIKAKVVELTAGKATELEKAQAIYAFVSSQIRYIGVAFGIGRYQPHLASEVLANQYGDCKDKHTLLSAMFAAAGLHSDPALIGAGVRFNPAVPSPAAFNHLITHLTLAGQEVWLDATAEVGPWRALLPVIRDHQALVVPSAAAPSIQQTPADLPYPPYSTFTVASTLETSLDSDAQIVFTFRDDTEIALRAVLRSVSPSDYGAFVQNLMGNLGFGGTTSEPVLDHLNDSSQPLTLRFHYHRVKDKSWGDNRITATFAPIGLPAFAPEKPPTSSIQLGPLRSETSTVEVAFPQGWQVDLPETVHAHTSFATCDVTWHLDHGKLFEERKLVILKKEVPASSGKEYQSWYDTAGISGVPFIQVIPKIAAASVPTHTAPTPPITGETAAAQPSNPEAAKLVVSAGEKIQALDLGAARKLLDDARALNPTERGLWLGYGAVASQYGVSTEAVEDFQRELSYHPEQVQLYSYIAQEQRRRGNTAAAVKTLRAWIAAAPDNSNAAVILVETLTADKKFMEAVSEAQAAITRLGKDNPDLPRLHLVSSEALCAAGDTTRAAAEAQPLLSSLTDPMQINSVAYTLAQANVAIPEAELAQRKAVAALEDQTAGWTVAEPDAAVSRLHHSLAAAWDTLGWILYREKKYDEALGYLNAAARIAGGKEVHDHIAAIAAALRTPASSALARADDQQLRTLSLGSAKGRHGTAELRALLVDGKIVATGPFADTNVLSAPGSAPRLADADQLLKAGDLHSLLPPGSRAHILRSGIVNCHNSTCEFVLLPIPQS